MIENQESAVLGYRCLIMEARRAGEWEEVERLSADVGRLKPDMPWLDWVRFEGAARRQAWDEAGAALLRLAPTRMLEPETLRRHRAALFIAKSQKEAGSGNSAAALEAAEEAVDLAPKWLPGLINLARRQAAGNFTRAVRRTVEKAWAILPHPQLAEALELGDQNPITRYKQIVRLCRDTEQDPVSHLAEAEAAIAADIWGEARRHLMALIGRNQATQMAYRLLAKLERRENGDERAALLWLTKAADAPPDPAWLCSSCGGAHEDWQATCRACGAFATLDWRIPGVSHIGGRAASPLLSDWSE
jgi:HemY protein